jgi:hypothetical protein
MSTDFASPESGAINSSSLPETGLANELSRVTRKKSCRGASRGVCAKTAAAVQVNASSANLLQQRKGLSCSLKVASLSSLKLNTCGKLKGPESAGAKESACRAHGGIEIGLHRLRGLAVLCRLVGANGNITPRKWKQTSRPSRAEEFVAFRAATLRKLRSFQELGCGGI